MTCARAPALAPDPRFLPKLADLRLPRGGGLRSACHPRATTELHWRRDAVAADIHRSRGERTVRLPLHRNDDLGARFELTLFARLKRNDRGIRRHDHLLLLG